MAGIPGIGALHALGARVLALRCLGAALAFAFLLGCASQSRRERVVLLGSPEQVYLILPLNLASAIPSEVEPYSAVIWQEIERYLRAHDKQLKTVAPEVARKLWIKSVQKVRVGERGASAGFEDAARALAVELRKHAEFGAMVAPSVFIREAPISERSARWDGVERELELEQRGSGVPSVADMPFEGVAPAASLHIAIFDPTGDEIHEGKGGLELLVRVRVAGEDAAGLPTFEFTPRSTALREPRARARGDHRRLRAAARAAEGLSKRRGAARAASRRRAEAEAPAMPAPYPQD